MDMAPELLNSNQVATRPPRTVPPPYRPMNKEFQITFTAVVLVIVTAAAATFAWINFQKESEFQVPSDGIWWVEKHSKLVADHVDEDGPGAKAGVKVGDELAAVNQAGVRRIPELVRQQYRTGVYSKATYSLVRNSIPVDTQLVLVPAERSLNPGLRLIGLIYLGIGLYVLLRRWTAPKSTHFYLFCLVSFVFYSFKYTGKLNEFDWIIY